MYVDPVPGVSGEEEERKQGVRKPFAGVSGEEEERKQEMGVLHSMMACERGFIAFSDGL